MRSRCAIPLLVVACAVAPGARVASADWSMFHGDPRHSGISADRSSNVVAWSYLTSDTIEFTSPAIGPDGTIYVANLLGDLLALRNGGNLRWKLSGLPGVRYSTPAVAADGTIYLGGADSSLYAIDPAGTVRWRFRTTGAVRTSPNLGADGTIYFGADDGRLYALAPNDSLEWTYATGDSIRSSPAIGPDGTIFFGSEDAYFYALNPNGTLRWRALTGAQIKYCSPAVSADGVVYFGSYDGFLYAMTSAGGFKWAYNAAHVVRSSPAVGPDGTVYLGVNTDLVALDPTSGAVRFKHATTGVIYSAPAYLAQDSVVVVGSDDSTLYAVHADSAAVNYGHTAWNLRLAGSVRSSPAPDGAGNLIVGDMAGKVWALGPTITAAVPAGPPLTARLRVRPNPSHGEVRFEVPPGLPRAPIEVFDLRGRRVAVVSAGADGYRWSARAAPGVYLYRLAGGGATGKLVLLQ